MKLIESTCGRTVSLVSHACVVNICPSAALRLPCGVNGLALAVFVRNHSRFVPGRAVFHRRPSEPTLKRSAPTFHEPYRALRGRSMRTSLRMLRGGFALGMHDLWASVACDLYGVIKLCPTPFGCPPSGLDG